MSADSNLKQTWRKVLAKMAENGHRYRKSLVWRTYEAMGAEQALLLADNRKVVLGGSRISALRASIKYQRALQAQNHWAYNPSLHKKYIAALLWIRRLNKRDQEWSLKGGEHQTT